MRVANTAPRAPGWRGAAQTERMQSLAPTRASTNGCAMPGRVDLRAVARGKECNASASRAECESSFMSGWPVAPHYLHGFNRPCTWDGTHCATGERAPCASLHDWHRCPRLGETWLELSGHPSSGARSWTCTPNGEWPELGTISEPFASGRPGLGRLLAFSMSKEQCRAFPWRSRDVAWHAWGRQPAIFGLDNDVKRELRNTQWAYAVLAMDMYTRGTRGNDSHRPAHWTPCTNLAFTMCALRGFLANDVPQFAEGSGGRLYLATRGSDLLRRCRPHVLVPHLLHPNTTCSGSSCRQFDATWVRASPLGPRGSPARGLVLACAAHASPMRPVARRTSATSPSPSTAPLRALARMDTRSGTPQASGCVDYELNGEGRREPLAVRPPAAIRRQECNNNENEFCVLAVNLCLPPRS